MRGGERQDVLIGSRDCSALRTLWAEEAVIREQIFRILGSNPRLTLIHSVSRWGKIPDAYEALGFTAFAILLLFLAIRRTRTMMNSPLLHLVLGRCSFSHMR